MSSEKCSADGCSRSANIDGLCFTHYEIRKDKIQNILCKQILSELQCISERLTKLENIILPSNIPQCEPNKTVFIPSIFTPTPKDTTPSITTTNSTSGEWTVLPKNETNGE